MQAATFWNVKASILGHLHRGAEARAAAEQALAIADAKLAKRPNHIGVWDAKAMALRLLGREEEAQAAEARMAALIG
jgi:hypothetical protein